MQIISFFGVLFAQFLRRAASPPSPVLERHT